MKEINSIDKCKLCISINENLKCDSIYTKYSEPAFNFPCIYWNDREFWFEHIFSNDENKTLKIG